MLTSCPHCTTTFRVTPEQLKARQGRVRCSRCQEIFNAIDTLIEAATPPARLESLPASAVETTAVPQATPDTKTPEPESFAAEAAVPADAVEPSIAIDASGDAAEPVAEPVAAPGDDEEARVPVEPANEPTDEPTDEPTVASADEPVDEIAREVAPTLEPSLHEAPHKRTWPWAIGGGIATIVLAAQAAIHFRTEISVLYPAARPALVAACGAFGCQVALPRKPELIGIETSSLSPDAGGKLTLSATLRNRAPFAQQYPHLELALTDTGDVPLVRRVLAPADYLSPQAPAAGFGANAELVVNLAVEAPSVPAAGYQLYLFYP